MISQSAFLLDIYRADNKLCFWFKSKEGDFVLRKSFDYFIFVEDSVVARDVLKKLGVDFFCCSKKNYNRVFVSVLKVRVPDLSFFESFVRAIEFESRFSVEIFFGDVSPEQFFFFKYGLFPGCAVSIVFDDFSGDFVVRKLVDSPGVVLKTTKLFVSVFGNSIKQIRVDDVVFEGDEFVLLSDFLSFFSSLDPDVIFCDYAFARIPFLQDRLSFFNLSSPFHRFDDVKLRYRGGKSFFSYGNVMYRDFAVRLNGRFLVDSKTVMGELCSANAILELCELSSVRFQQVASRSFGSVFQGALVRVMVEQGFLVPFKKKPQFSPMSLFDYFKADRGPLYCDPLVGFHSDVAEIDFSSMFPWLIFNQNIGADTLCSVDGSSFVNVVPNLSFGFSFDFKGLVPLAIKPFIDRRMYYKSLNNSLYNERVLALKYVLVSSYGYLRFREFKMGIAQAHMAITAFARETLLSCIRIAESFGFVVVHGIVDSLYVKNKDSSPISKDKVLALCNEIELFCGIPVSFEGIFKWIVFLPSVVDSVRPLPATYYGCFLDGSIKARGIEVRKRSSPLIVKEFQRDVLNIMSSCCSYDDIRSKFFLFCGLLRDYVFRVSSCGVDFLVVPVKISKVNYKNNIPQRVVVEKYLRRGVSLRPGDLIHYVFSLSGIVLPDEYSGDVDVDSYKRLFVRALFVVLQPFGFSKKDIVNYVSDSVQLELSVFESGSKGLIESFL